MKACQVCQVLEVTLVCLVELVRKVNWAQRDILVCPDSLVFQVCPVPEDWTASQEPKAIAATK